MSGKKVLLVDDDKLIDKMISTFFMTRGISTEIAMNGIEGLEVLKQMKPDAIILDLMMPEMDGFEFCEQVKKNEQLKDIPIIAISAFCTEGNIKRILALGACYFFKKPFRVKELVDKVKAVIG
jgi:DNA-binding response OmpR family regulator